MIYGLNEISLPRGLLTKGKTRDLSYTKLYIKQWCIMLKLLCNSGKHFLVFVHISYINRMIQKHWCIVTITHATQSREHVHHARWNHGHHAKLVSLRHFRAASLQARTNIDPNTVWGPLDVERTVKIIARFPFIAATGVCWPTVSTNTNNKGFERGLEWFVSRWKTEDKVEGEGVSYQITVSDILRNLETVRLCLSFLVWRL